MHFEVLVEDQSGCIMLEAALADILGGNGAPHSWRMHPYRGLGHLPKGLQRAPDPAKRHLLNQLPRLLQGYARSLDASSSAVVVAVDLDDRDCIAFKRELTDVLNACRPALRALFRIAIEEFEAWLLGDRTALLQAYPKAKRAVLDRYAQDSICGTWEVLADAIHPGGCQALWRDGGHGVGAAKCEWARPLRAAAVRNSRCVFFDAAALAPREAFAQRRAMRPHGTAIALAW